MNLFIKEGRRFIPAPNETIINEAREIYAGYFPDTQALTSPDIVKEYLRYAIGTAENERFLVVYLTNQHKIIALETLFYGTIDSASVYPREVVKSCLKHNAAAVIFAHNHPSGLVKPSEGDKHITKKLKNALGLVDISVLDHFIVGTEIFSMAEHGLI
jgi:DNA repair protein RadC